MLVHFLPGLRGVQGLFRIRPDMTLCDGIGKRKCEWVNERKE